MADEERWNRATVPASPSGSPRPSRKAIASPFDPPADRFEEGDELGRGGMGRVFEARDVALDRAVAIKQSLTDDAQMLVRFEREALITAQLQHPGIVPVLDAGRDADGRPYYVMRKIEGRPLATVVKEATGARARLALLPNMLAAVDAVAYAHARGVIHRDLKPWNILLGPFGETFVIDWGLARDLAAADTVGGQTISGDDGLTRVGSAMGTPGFMAPEQARGDSIDRRADVYALGATLVHLLAGAQPFAGVDPTVAIERVSRDEIPHIEFPDEVPTELRAIALKAIAASPDERYADAGELASDLRRFLGGQLVAAHEYTVRERVVRWLRKHRLAVAIAMIATVALAVISTIAIRNVVLARDEAHAARLRADERADQLLVDRAEVLATTDATYAIALLKQLPPTSRTWQRARLVATTALASGIARGMALSRAGAHGRLLASPKGDIVALVVDGKLSLVDPDLRQPARLIVDDPEGVSGVEWFDNDTLIVVIEGKHVLRVSRDGARKRLDPGGNSVGLDMQSGEARIFARVDGNVRELDPAGGPPLADFGRHKYSDRVRGALIYGDDGASFTLQEDGKPPVTIHGFGVSTHIIHPDLAKDRIALNDNNEVIELQRTDGVWTERSRWTVSADYVVYRDKALIAIEGTGFAYLWPGSPPFRETAAISRDRQIIPSGALSTQKGVFVAGDSAIHTMHGGAAAVIATYSDPPASFAYAGDYLLVLARTGTLRSYDLRQFFPAVFQAEGGSRAEALDTARVWLVRNEQLQFFDLHSQTLNARLAGAYRDFDESSLACTGSAFAIVRLDERRRYFQKEPAQAAVLSPDGTLTTIEGTCKGALCSPGQRWLVLQGETSIEVRDPKDPQRAGRTYSIGAPILGVSLNTRWVAVSDETGKMTRIELATGKVLPPIAVGTIDAYTIDESGRVATTKGDAVTVWTDAGPRVVVDGLSIAVITGHADGILVFTRSKSVVVIDRALRVTRHDIGEAALSVAWDVPRVGIIRNGKAAVLDFRDGSVVRYPWGAQSIAIADDGNAIAWSNGQGQIDVLRLEVPEDPRELARWLDTITNATLEPGSTELVWR